MAEKQASVGIRIFAFFLLIIGGPIALFVLLMIVLPAISVVLLTYLFLSDKNPGWPLIIGTFIVNFLLIAWPLVRDHYRPFREAWVALFYGVIPEEPKPVPLPRGTKRRVAFSTVGPLLAVFFLIAVAGRNFGDELLFWSDNDALKDLSRLRAALKAYSIGHKGKFPKDLRELKGRFMPEIPYPYMRHHSAAKEVQHISGRDFRAANFSDAGGWAYVNEPGDRDWGKIVVNCTHKKKLEGMPEGQPWTAF